MIINRESVSDGALTFNRRMGGARGTLHKNGNANRVDGRVVFVSEGMAGLPVAVRPSSCDGVLDVVFLYKIVQKIDLREPR
ncbi:hypothetical protein [Achromobacter marplatensis]|uniref:hypothetical protein n=1 Tax=Achromobacter marplatensis TaxID=470868 RepID=UPI0039F72031